MADLNTLEDFLENDRFRQWVKSPDGELKAYWEDWLTKNPSKRSVFESAVATSLLIEGRSPAISDEYIRRKISVIRQNIETSEDRRFSLPLPMSVLKWAAALIVGLGVGWVLVSQEVFFRDQDISMEGSGKGINHSSAPMPHDTVRSFTNPKSQQLLVNLPDGSSVVLSKGSSLQYDMHGGEFQRKVRLAGEGFFEVAKDPAHPFFVYTSHLTTRVLGTSFLVRSFEGEPKATVSVRTGKVSVTPAKTDERARKASPDTLLLTPNEQVSLVVATEQMVREDLNGRGRSSLPELLQKPKYEFHLTPVTQVFALLEKAYGVPIRYDAQAFGHCTLTAVLSDEPFLDKIRMICVGIEADFEVRDNQVFITGDGCGIP